MSDYRTRLTDREDLLWLAGLLEGEGCFDLQKGRYPRVRVAMTDRDVVGRAATLIGSSVRLTQKRFAAAKSTWHAEVQGARAVEVMRAVLPFMGARRSQRIADVLGDATLIGTLAKAPAVKPTRPPGLPLDR